MIDYVEEEELPEGWKNTDYRDGRIVRVDGAYIVMAGPVGSWRPFKSNGKYIARKYYRDPFNAMSYLDDKFPMITE